MASAHDKVLDHTRAQLSALFDGELDMDAARFLQRRLEHDRALAGAWSRWQLAGDALRGQATAPAPAGFAERVAAGVARAPAPVAPARPRRHFWMPGAALAASVAALAMFMTRPPPDVAAPAGPTMEIASAAQPSAKPPLPAAPSRPAPQQPPAPAGAAEVAASAMAVAEVPRRAAERRARAQQQRAAATRVARNAAAPQRRLAAAASAPAAAADARANPFAPAEAAGAIATRPWPRALLPGPAQAFSVGYGQLQPTPSVFQRYAPFTGDAAPAPASPEPEDVP